MKKNISQKAYSYLKRICESSDTDILNSAINDDKILYLKLCFNCIPIDLNVISEKTLIGSIIVQVLNPYNNIYKVKKINYNK